MSQTEEDCTLVLNDLLCFTWCNLELCPEEKLLAPLQDFYSKEEALDSFKILLKVLPTNMRGRLLQNTREPNAFLAIIKVMKNVVQEDLPIFVCKDLNNVPSINFTKEKLRSCSKQSFYEEQSNMKSQISEIHDVLNQLKDQCQTLVSKNINFYRNKLDIEVKMGNGKKFISGSTHDGGEVQSSQNHLHSPDEKEVNSLFYLEEDITMKSEEVDEDYEEPKLSPKSIKNLRTLEKIARSTKKPLNRIKDIIEDAEEFDEDWEEQRLNPKGNKHQGTIKRVAKSNSKKNPPGKENWHKSKGKEKGGSASLDAENAVDDSIGELTIYKCAHCKFTSINEATANLHRCFQRLSHQKNLKESEQLTLGPGYTCNVCNLTFKLTNDLKAHRETHNTTDHRCPLCLERFSVEEWLEHVRQCPGNGTTRREDHYCPNCDIFFADKRILLFHMSYHDVAKQFECLECKFRFYTQKAVSDHFRSHIESEYKLKCPFCYFRADKNYRIQEHIRSHTGDFPYKCHLCDRSTSTYGAIKTHIETHNSSRDFKCDVCGKAYKSRKKLVSHKRIHTTEKPHKCPVCGKCFKLGILMKHHHRIHLDIRAHQCPQCSYKTRYATALKRHLNTHTVAKSFVCSQCDFRASHKRYINAHIKRHHPVKPETDDDM